MIEVDLQRDLLKKSVGPHFHTPHPHLPGDDQGPGLEPGVGGVEALEGSEEVPSHLELIPGDTLPGKCRRGVKQGMES